MVGERGAQCPHAAVGIAVQLANGAVHRLDRLGERRERSLVRGKLDDPVEAELALHVVDGLSGLVRDEIGDRPPKRALAHPSAPSSPRLRRQTRSAPVTPATIPAAAPPVRALGTLEIAFCLTTLFVALR